MHLVKSSIIYLTICLLYRALDTHPVHKKHKHKKHVHKNSKGKHEKLHNIKKFFANNLRKDLIDPMDDVTDEINSKYERVNYFINPNELPFYQNQFETIKNLGSSIQCKIRGDCQGMRREDIPDQLQQQQIQENEEQKAIIDMAERQMHNRLLRADGPEMPQRIPDMSAAADNSDDNPYSKQSNAAQFGQQQQMNIKMPDGMQQDREEKHGEEFAQQNQQGGGPQTHSGMMQPGMDPSLAANQQNDEMIRNSVQNKLAFMDQANKFQSAAGGNSELEFARNEEAQLKLNNQQEKDDMNGPHGLPSSESSAVSDKDIMKAEGIAPNEMHDLHDFLKQSNDMNPSASHGLGDRRHQRERMNEFASNDDRSEERENYHRNHGDRYHDNPSVREHHSRKFMNKFHSNNDGEERNSPPQESFYSHGRENNHERNPMSSFKSRKAMFNQQSMEVPNLDSVLGGPAMPPPQMARNVLNDMTGGMRELGGMRDPSSDYVEQNAKQMMQSNSDYKLPGTTFTNLWKSFMLTTQSQLGEADPSANSREGLMGVQKKDKSSSPRGVSGGAPRWKKSNVMLH